MNDDQIVTISAPKDVLLFLRDAMEYFATGIDSVMDEPVSPEQIEDAERIMAAIEILDEALAQ